jgi:plastocyanin
MVKHMLSLFLVFGGVLATPAQATDFDVDVGGGGLVFTPDDLTVHVGDSVTFRNLGGFHNVATDPDAVTQFRCAVGCDGTDGDPSGADWSFTIEFDDAGPVPYHCEVHGAPGAGMHGSITVVGDTPPPPVGDVGPASFDFALATGETASDTLEIANTGDAASMLEFAIDEADDSCSTPAQVPWLAESPTTGSIGGGSSTTVALDIDSSGLGPGGYVAYLCMSTNDPGNLLVTVPVSLTLTPADRIFAGDFDTP